MRKKIILQFWYKKALIPWDTTNIKQKQIKQNNYNNKNSNNPMVLRYRVGVGWAIAMSRGWVRVFSLGWKPSSG